MLFQINGFTVLEKASKDGVIAVDIIANHLTEDRENETMLKEAFDKDTVKEFLDIGVIEFWHESRNPALTKKEKFEAIIGKPVAFRFNDEGKPVVTAHLTADHELVKGMIPHLKAKQPVYGASMGGGKVAMEVSDAEGKKHRVIPRIKWDHLAIAPSNNVINRSPGLNVSLLQKADGSELFCEFNSIDHFISGANNVFENEQVLMKALMAPSSVSDMYSAPGGVVTKQSLESKIANLTLSEDEGFDLLDTIIGIKKKTIPLKKADYLDHFKKQNKEEFGKKSYSLISKYMTRKK